MRIYDSKIFRLLRIKVLRNTSSQPVTRTARAGRIDDTASVRSGKNGEGVTGVTEGVTSWTRFLQGLRLLVFLSRFEDFNIQKTTPFVTGVTGMTGSMKNITRTYKRVLKCLALKVSTFISFLRKVCKSYAASVTSVTPNSRNNQSIKQLQKILRNDEKSRILHPAFPRIVLLSRGPARDRCATTHRPDQARPAALCGTHPQRQPAVRQTKNADPPGGQAYQDLLGRSGGTAVKGWGFFEGRMPSFGIRHPVLSPIRFLTG